jgi:hypothetical protein
MLDTCAFASLSEDRHPHRVTQDVTIHWHGGDLVQRASASASPRANDRNPLDTCFVLTTGKTVVATGAVVSHFSARLLRFDTLVRRSDHVLEFDLLPSYPGQLAQSVRAEWNLALTPLSLRNP